ncbi:MAG: fatty acid desaturase, partial [Cyanobacteria bacterium P01_F01_bin.153]
WWSHMLWLIYQRKDFFDAKVYYKGAPDLAKDPVYRFLDRYFLAIQALLGLVLYALGGWSFVIYGIFVRSVLLWHRTWLINSATHIWGYQTFPNVKDGSGNLWWAALLTYGEGWHNNHHAYPRVAKAGWQWWEIDMTWWVIKLLKSLGLATKVVMPPKSLMK